MPKKSRKRRVKQKGPSSPQRLGARGGVQPSQAPPLLPKQTSGAKHSVAIEDNISSHQYLRSDIKRSLVIAAVLIAILIILRFLLI